METQQRRLPVLRFVRDEQIAVREEVDAFGLVEQRRVELEHLAGTVIRRGKAVGVPTPTFDTVYAILRIKVLSYGGAS